MQKRKLAWGVVMILFSAAALAAQTEGSFDNSVAVSGPVELDV